MKFNYGDKVVTLTKDNGFYKDTILTVICHYMDIDDDTTHVYIVRTNLGDKFEVKESEISLNTDASAISAQFEEHHNKMWEMLINSNKGK